MAVDFKKEIGFTTVSSTSSPSQRNRPSDQYDSDSAACFEFPARVRPARSLQAQHRDQPCNLWPAIRSNTNCKSAAASRGAARLDRRQRGRRALGLGHRANSPPSVYDTTKSHARSFGNGRIHHGRAEFRLQTGGGNLTSRSIFSMPTSGEWTRLPEGRQNAAAIRADGRYENFLQGPLLTAGSERARSSRSRTERPRWRSSEAHAPLKRARYSAVRQAGKCLSTCSN